MDASKRQHGSRRHDRAGPQDSTRLLFLDFDGVLHPSEASPNFPLFCWLPILERLLLPHREVVILVHSTWRYDHTNHELSELLGTLSARFAGSAPRGPREQVIGTVLQANLGQVLDYLVLDDDIKAFQGSSLNVLATDPHLGLSSEATQAALSAWLSGNSSELESAPCQSQSPVAAPR